MGKSPAFQFYPSDWLSSANIAMMTPAEEGAYIRLLCYAWSDPDCSIPDDDEILARLSRLGEGWLKGGSQMVRECFEPHPTKTGRLVNVRLLAEREKQARWREKSKQGGINSGKSRTSKAKKQSKGGSKMVEPNGNSSVFSLQSSSESTSSKEDVMCGAGDEPPDSTPEPSIMEFPCLGNSVWHLRQSKVDEWTEAYAGVDIMAECRKARQWVRDNPTRRKKPRGMTTYLSKWLSTAHTQAKEVQLRDSQKRYLPGFGELEHYDPIPPNARR